MRGRRVDEVRPLGYSLEPHSVQRASEAQLKDGLNALGKLREDAGVVGVGALHADARQQRWAERAEPLALLVHLHRVKRALPLLWIPFECVLERAHPEQSGER